MTWTINANLKIHLAETGDVESSLAGGSLRLYSSEPSLLATIPIVTCEGQGDGTVDLTFNQNVTPEAGTVARADLVASDGITVRMTTSDVADIDCIGAVLNTGLLLNTGAFTISLAGLEEI